jgi:hypothetical protein
MVHGFYAAMGGYVIRSHYLDEQHPITGQGRLTLTKCGILWLLEVAPDVFPGLSEDEILDKSKASTLIKALTCLQALWFCLQCIVRLTANTTISLLELNVYCHCICIFVIYAIWWNKPMDVSEPTTLDLERKLELQALLALLCSHTTYTVPRLPPLLAKCAFKGLEYRGWVASPDFCTENRSYRYRVTQLHDDSEPCRHFLSLFTSIDGLGFTAPGSMAGPDHGCGPSAEYGEEQTDECAGLRIEQLMQLLNVNGSDPEM